MIAYRMVFLRILRSTSLVVLGICLFSLIFFFSQATNSDSNPKYVNDIKEEKKILVNLSVEKPMAEEKKQELLIEKPLELQSTLKPSIPPRKKRIPGLPVTVEISRFFNRHCRMLNSKIDNEREDSKTNRPWCPCINPESVGRIDVNMERIPLSVSDARFSQVSKGGSWAPSNCQPRQHLAVIIPYRDRLTSLEIMLPRLHTVLQTQQLNYTVFVIEQRYPDETIRPYFFNRGALMNIGFLEALKLSDYDCFIFHDVDFVSEDDRTPYMCGNAPIHLGAWNDQHDYELYYDYIFGAVNTFNRTQFEEVNGFSNRYFGWGAEDDDMSSRLSRKFHRLPKTLARFKTVKHQGAVGKTVEEHNKEQWFTWETRNPAIDGLNSIKSLYNRLDFKQLPLFTWVLTDIYWEPLSKYVDEKFFEGGGEM